tara:strand:- start:110 stop:565 length:456 start_codon:yes stop_codon:yes gene_type:complete
MYDTKSFNADLVTLSLKLKPTIDKLYDLEKHYGLQDKEGQAHAITECIDIMKKGIRQIENNAKEDAYNTFEEIAVEEGMPNIGEAMDRIRDFSVTTYEECVSEIRETIIHTLENEYKIKQEVIDEFADTISTTAYDLVQREFDNEGINYEY